MRVSQIQSLSIQLPTSNFQLPTSEPSQDKFCFMWPRLFSRYVLSEVLVLSSITLFTLTTVIMLGVVMHQLIAAGLGIQAFLRMLPYATLISLQFAVPSTLLFAVCSVYGRMSADNELIAVKSLGIHPLRVIMPTFILALVISPVVVWVNDLAMSWGQPGLNRVVLHSLEEIVYGFLTSNGSYSTQSGLMIHVEDVQDRWLIHPTIMTNSGNETNTIIAEKAKISLNEEKEMLVIELVNWQSDNGEHWKLDGGQDAMTLEMPLEKAARKNASSFKISQVALSEMAMMRATLEREGHVHEQALMSRNAIAMVSGRFVHFDDVINKEHQTGLADVEKKMFRLHCEPWRRWALGFSCFSFVFMGVPLAIIKRSADYWTSFGVCFLPILVLYYPLFALGVDRSKNGEWPAYSPFLGNICMIAFGCLLLRKIYKS